MSKIELLAKIELLNKYDLKPSEKQRPRLKL